MQRYSHRVDGYVQSKGERAAAMHARIVSSVTVFAMTLVMGTFVAQSISPPFSPRDLARDGGAPPRDGASVSVDDSVHQAREVVLDRTAASSDRPCEEQAWPYIDSRCLKNAAAKTDAGLSHPPDSKPVREPEPHALTSAQPVRSEGSEAPREMSAQPVPVAAAIPVPVPLPVPRPADIDAVPETARQAMARAAPAGGEEVQQPRRKASRHAGTGDPRRIVRRWREYVYRLPHGGIRRVQVFPRGYF